MGELVKVEHGFAFKGEYFSDTGELVVLTPGNFHERGGFKLRPDKDRFYQGKFPDRYLLNRNDLIVAMTEQGEGLLGSSALIPESGKVSAQPANWFGPSAEGFSQQNISLLSVQRRLRSAADQKQFSRSEDSSYLARAHVSHQGSSSGEEMPN